MATVDSSGSTPFAGPETSSNRRSETPRLITLFLFLAVVFITLHGRNYDGDALKQAVWDHSTPHIATPNHAYSGAWVWGWWQLGARFVSPDFDARMAWVESLNGLLGAGAATLCASCLLALGIRRSTAYLSALALAASHAWFYHSTQITEPIMAEFWLMLSLRFTAAIPRRGVPAVVASALAWAVAVGAYQTYILAGLGLLWLIAQNRRHILPWLVTAAVAGTAIYLLAAVLKGARNLSGVITYLTTKTDGDYWGFIRPAALLQLPFGLANALTPPWPLTTHWPGLRLGWAGLGLFSKFTVAGIVLSIGLLTLATLFRPAEPSLRRWKQALFVIFACGLFAPFYLLPYYNKLWLLSLGAWVMAVALTADHHRWLRRSALLLAVLFFGRNLMQVYPLNVSQDNPQQRHVLALERTLKPGDLLVCDGWDASNLYFVRNPKQPVFQLIYQPVSEANLAKAVQEARARNGQVYFFNLLERPEEQFNLSDVATRGKAAWFPLVKTYLPRCTLVWSGGDDHQAVGDLYRLDRP